MNRNDAAAILVGRLAGLDQEDDLFDEKVSRLIECERNFPGFADSICRMVRGKIFQKYPITDDMLVRAAQLSAVDKLQANGLHPIHTSDFLNMEVNSDHRGWGTVKTWAPQCRGSQYYFSKYLQSGKASDMKKVLNCIRSNY